MSKIKKLYIFIYKFIERINNHKISVYSAQASFYIVLSVFPLIMLIFAIIGKISIPSETLYTGITEFVPDALKPLITQVLDEMYTNSTSMVLSVTTIVLLWSASKSVYVLMTGMYVAFDIEDKRNYFIARTIAIFYTFLFIVVIIFTLTILVFGNSLYHFLESSAPFFHEILKIFFGNRTLIVLMILILFFILLYRTVRNSGYTILDLLPGAIFSSLGWLIFSYLFSIYIDNFSNYSYMYGSLTTIILLMLWLYVCMYILFLGAEINVTSKTEFARLENYFKYKKAANK